MSNKSSAHSKTDRTRKRKRPDPDGRAPPLRGREEILPETNSSGRQDRESNTTTKTVQLKSANEGSKRRWKVTELLAEADSTVALEDGEEDHTPLPENKRRKRAVLWRDEEIKKLHDAFTNFVKTQGYTENEIIQYVFSKEHKKNSEARKVRSKLSAALADAVQERGKASVWARFLRCYHPHRAMGTWTEEEDQILLEMSELEGVTNRMIGEEIGRSFYDVIDRLKVLRSGKAPPHKLIKWTEAETQRLIEGIKKVTTQYGYGPYDSELEFGWSLVAAYVGTRSIPKCITTWKKLVEKGKVKQPASYNRSETRRQVDDIFFSEDQFREFIKRLRESKVERLADIDWHDFLSGGWCPLDFNQCRQWMRLNFHGRLRWKLILLSLEEVLQALEDKRAAGLLRFTGSRSRAKRTGAAGPRSSVLRI
ncbi:Cyclin-D-binding Myb-like transcription factor 1, partial [Spiromyces aspiralis]